MAAYLTRFKGQSRLHTECDLHAYLTWCRSHELDPLAAQRPHLELYMRSRGHQGQGRPVSDLTTTSEVARLFAPTRTPS